MLTNLHVPYDLCLGIQILHLSTMGGNLAQCLKRFLNVKALICTFNKDKALVDAFFISVIIKSSRTFVCSSTVYCSSSSECLRCEESEVNNLTLITLAHFYVEWMGALHTTKL